MDAVDIKLPLDAYLRKYLIGLLGREPIRLNKSNRFGAFLIPHLKASAQHPHEIGMPDCKVCFQIKLSQVGKVGTSVGAESKHRFRQFVKKDFYSALENYVDAATLYNSELMIRQAIEDFMDRYGLIEDTDGISYEALKKHYYRYRKAAV